MLRSQLKSYSGADPIWGFVSLVGSERFTGEAVLGPTPRVHLYAVDGRIYYAEREGDQSVGERLLAAGSITAAQLDQGTVEVGGSPSLARLFQRQPLIDRDAIELTIEAATETLLESVAALAAGEAEVFPLRHHPSGIHHWLRSAGANPLPTPSMAAPSVPTATAAAPPQSAAIADGSPAEPTTTAVLAVSEEGSPDEPMPDEPISDEPAPIGAGADPEPTPAAEAYPAAAEPEPDENTFDEASDTGGDDTGGTPPELDTLRWGAALDGAEEGLEETNAGTDTASTDTAGTDTASTDTASTDTASTDTDGIDASTDTGAGFISDATDEMTPAESWPDRSPAPSAEVADLPLVARLAALPATDSSDLSGLPAADELPPLGAVTYLPMTSAAAQSVPATGRPTDAEINIFAPVAPAAGDNLPKLAAAPIGVDELMSDQAARATSGSASQPNSMAAVEIWEMVDSITTTPPAAPAPPPAADEPLARGWRRGNKDKSR